jgi:polysaccharide biosynthesis/export protein
MIRSFFSLGVIALLLVSVCPAQTNAASGDSVHAAASAAAPAGFQNRDPRYHLRKGDSADLEFSFSPEFNQSIAVQPDGYVTLKEVGSLHVEGQTVPDLAATVQHAYAQILHDPVVTIKLKNFEMPYFIASGELGKPGKYDLRSDLTVTQAVAIAGGFNEKSKHSQVVLFRPLAGGGFQAKVIDVKKLLATRNLSEDLTLQPGDTLYVPQNRISKLRPYLPVPNVGAYYNPATF